MSFSSYLNSVNNSHGLRSARKILMTQAYLYAACVELAELLELTAMLMKKTSIFSLFSKKIEFASKKNPRLNLRNMLITG